MMSAKQNRLIIPALALSIIALLVSLYAVVAVQSLAASINELQSSLNELKNTVSSLQQQLAKLPTQLPTPPAPKVKLVVIGPWSGDEAKYFQAVIDAYVKTHPNVDIEYRTMRAEDVAAVMPVQFAAGVAPGDVIFGWAWFIAKMGKEGHLVDLTGVVNEKEYVPGIVDTVKADGKIWGAPFTMWLKPGFWYRKSFFQKYGLAEPKSYSEFVQLLEKIKGIQGVKNPLATGDGVGWPISDIVEHFIIAYGGPQMQLNLISGKTRFNDPSVRKVFTDYIVPLLQKGYFSEPTEWTTVIPKSTGFTSWVHGSLEWFRIQAT
jgi:multiple sugar transport system substrate-binding protein